MKFLLRKVGELELSGIALAMERRIPILVKYKKYLQQEDKDAFEERAGVDLPLV